MRVFWEFCGFAGRCGRCAVRRVGTSGAGAGQARRSQRQDRLPGASLTGKGAEWGQTAKISMEIAVEEINAKGGIGGVPAELICYDTQTLEAEGAEGGQPAGRARQACWPFPGRASAREFETIAPQLDQSVEDRHQLVLLGKARALGDEQLGIPQYADQRQAAQASGRGLGQGIQPQEGRHHL